MERRRRFIEAYRANLGWPTRAARLAGCPEAGVRVAACRMKNEPDVKAAIDAAWQEWQDEVDRERREREATQAAARELQHAKFLRDLYR